MISYGVYKTSSCYIALTVQGGICLLRNTVFSGGNLQPSCKPAVILTTILLTSCHPHNHLPIIQVTSCHPHNHPQIILLTSCHPPSANHLDNKLISSQPSANHLTNNCHPASQPLPITFQSSGNLSHSYPPIIFKTISQPS